MKEPAVARPTPKPYPTTLTCRLRQLGFSLTELMFAVAIVGILASIALPSYRSHFIRSSRAEAKAILLETAQFLERNYTLNSCYHRTDAACATTTANVTLPYAQSPRTGTAKYNITVSYSTTSPCTLGNCFTLSAAPTGTMANDACGTLTLTNAGIRGQASGQTVDYCWQR
jgi:type IV pilus assembly protein PilE